MGANVLFLRDITRGERGPSTTPWLLVLPQATGTPLPANQGSGVSPGLNKSLPSAPTTAGHLLTQQTLIEQVGGGRWIHTLVL